MADWLEARRHRGDNDEVHPALASLGTRTPRADPKSWVEPWFYRFLEMFARTLLLLCILGVISLAILAFLAVVGSTWITDVDYYAPRFVMMAAMAGVLFLVILFVIALTLLVVDAGRNLRAINFKLSRIVASSDPDPPSRR